MNPVRLIADPDTVLAFALGGIQGRVATTAAEAVAAVQALVDEVQREGGPQRAPVLILVSARVAALIRDYLSDLVLDTSAPLVLEIPGFGEPAGESRSQRRIKRVLGIRR
jgi:vacuolar-type H+-ATPase subunit F/Vma7